MRKIEINNKYRVLEIKKDNLYCYYLEKIQYGNLWHLFDVNKKLTKPAIIINGLNHISFAESVKFWGEEYE